jgi:hypothetical protein
MCLLTGREQSSGWGLFFILILMVARALNILAIMWRSAPTDPKPLKGDAEDQDRHHHVDDDDDEPVKYYYVRFSDERTVRLRGRPPDLDAVTSDVWLRKQSNFESYLEGATKLIVVLVGAFSSNMSQSGSIVFMGLMITSAALLGYSNKHTPSAKNNGRLLAVGDAQQEEKRGEKGNPPYPTKNHWSSPSGFSGMDDWKDEGQVGAPIRGPHAFAPNNFEQ